MSERSDPPHSDSTKDLLSGWNLGGEPAAGADDSLLTPPRPEPPAEPVQAVTPPDPLPFARPADLSDPFHAFQLDEDPRRLSQDLRSLLRPARALVGLPPGAGVLPARAVTAICAKPQKVATNEPRRTIASLKTGDVVGGFRIITELGRGAFARVFLAEQSELAFRRVALKVSKSEGNEPNLLARLQHTHIVPIHSVADDPVSGLRLLCMPYLGGANLAQVLEAAGSRTVPARHRRSLVGALDEVNQRYKARSEAASAACSRPGMLAPSAAPGSISEGSTVKRAQAGSSQGRGAGSDGSGASRSLAGGSSLGSMSPSRLQGLWSRLGWGAPARGSRLRSLDESDFDQPARQFLRHANSIQASVWIIARLAEGLEHAHSRGLLHRDLKPSNVLIAADGTPMLLDFNLSTLTAPSDPEEGEKAMLGGTLPYMAPEHLAAFNPEGGTSGSLVDERSDIYALGLILFEMIAGEHPFPEPPPGTPLLDVIERLTAMRQNPPSLRAYNPAVPPSLEAIVRKCIDPIPARRYSRARDLADDLGRFLDDLPLKFAPETSYSERMAKWARRHPRCCHTISIAGSAAVILAMLIGIVALLADTMQNQNARLKLKVFRSQFQECQFLLNLGSGPVEHLKRGLELAAKTIDGQGLTQAGALRRDSWVKRLVKSEDDDVRRDTAELMMLEARARVRLAGAANSESVLRETLEWAVKHLDRAERLKPDSPSALYADRARYHAALGQAELAALDRDAAARPRPATSRDLALLGTSRLSTGDLAGAEMVLLQAVEKDPRDFWAHFALGHCRFEQGRFLDAAGDFNACIALEPNFAWPYLNRGLALARAGRLGEARQTYERALKANPRFAEAWVDIALTELELNDLEAAERSLDQAVTLGRTEIGVLAARAEVKARRGDRAAAARQFDRLLRDHPDDPSLLTAHALFIASTDPNAARADLDRALQLDPSLARAHYGMAVLLRLDAPREALKQIEQALAADPDLIDAIQLRALLRGRLGDLAAIGDVDRLCQVPNAYRYYNAACSLALLVEKAGERRLATRALQLLDRALDAGFPPARAAADADLASLRNLPEYRAILDHRRGGPRAGK